MRSPSGPSAPLAPASAAGPAEAQQPSELLARLPSAQAALLLAVAFVISLLRAPRLLLEGRVFAEEGVTYLHYAWSAAPLRALCAPHQGYYSLASNLAGLAAARLLPLSAAGLLFPWSALAILLLTAYLLLTCELLTRLQHRLLALLVFLFTTSSYEVWLNVIEGQFVWAAGTAILLVSSLEKRVALRLGYLTLAALSSLSGCALLPLFWLRALRSPASSPRARRIALLQAAMLTAGTCVQTVAVLVSLRAKARVMPHHDFRYMGPLLFERMVVQPLVPGRYAFPLHYLFQTHHGPAVLAACTLLGLAYVAALVWIVVSARLLPLLWLVAAALAIFALNWYGCADCGLHSFTQMPMNAGRYFYGPLALIEFALVVCAVHARRTLIRRLAALLVAIALLNGVQHYRGSRVFLNDYPAWRPQIAAWSRDPSRPILVAPTGWEHVLSLPPARGNDAHLPFYLFDGTYRPTP